MLTPSAASRLNAPAISVVMPTFGQAEFIERALESLWAQSESDWELLLINDASPDDTEQRVQPWLNDARCRYQRLPRNVGLGAALNQGLNLARAPLIAYLPSDDLWYREHLTSLRALFEQDADLLMAIAGVRHHYNRDAMARIEGESLQLVQVMHRAQAAMRWTERDELVTDDLGAMFFDHLAAVGRCAQSQQISCEWVDHPAQLHKLLREPEGGIARYRQRFQCAQPLRFKTTVGNLIDEPALVQALQQRVAAPKKIQSLRTNSPPPAVSASTTALKILLVGELAYNADRIAALCAQGHQLYGLWMPDPYWYNTVGPLPYGDAAPVVDIPHSDWETSVERIQPDVVYALLNWQAVPFVHHVLQRLRAHAGLRHLPFIWHFKEGPFICREKGSWRELEAIYRGSDGRIYCSDEMQAWTALAMPQLPARAELVLDGDLPGGHWFERGYATSTASNLTSTTGTTGMTGTTRDADTNSPVGQLSTQRGALHTVVPGRPIGLHPPTLQELASLNIHLHFYGDFTHGQWRRWIDSAQQLAPHHLHLHPHVDQRFWASEFAQYDAGWLHFFASRNHGDLQRANWDDLNVPARLATLAAAGLPVLQRNNSGHAVATQSIASRYGLGLLFNDMRQLREQCDQGQLAQARQAMEQARLQFAFDTHVPRLVTFFQQVMADTRLRQHGQYHLPPMQAA